MAENNGELNVKVSIDVDTSSVQSDLQAMVSQIQDQAIDLKVKAATEGAQGELKGLQDQIDQLVGHIGILDSQMDDFAYKLQNVAEDIKKIYAQLEDTMTLETFYGNTSDIYSVEVGLDKLSETVEALQKRMDDFGKGGQSFQNMGQTAETTAKGFEEASKAIESTQQASNDATKTIVANEKEKVAVTEQATAAIEKQTEAIQKRNWAQEALDKDYNVTGKKAAREQLDYNYTKYFDDSSMHGFSLTTQLKSCYAYLQSLINALDAGVNDKYLKKYQTANVHWPEDIGASEYYAQPNNTIVQQWERINSEVRIYADLIDRVNASGINTKAVPNLTKYMEEIVRTQGALTTANFSADTEQAKVYSDQLQKLNSAFDDLLQRHAQKQGIDNGAISQMAEQSKETVANLQEEKSVADEATQAATASAEAVVNAENQKQVEAQETVEAFNKEAEAIHQAGNWAQELLDKDFTAKNRRGAEQRLNNAYKQNQQILSHTDEDGRINGLFYTNTKAGAAAGYNLGKAYIEAFNKGVQDSKLENDYWDETLFGSIKAVQDTRPGYHSPNEVMPNLENVQYAVDQCEVFLKEYSRLYDQVASQMNGQPLTSDMENQIERIASIRKDLSGAQKSIDEILSWDKNADISAENQFISQFTEIAGELEAELQRMVEAEAGVTSTTNEATQEIGSNAQQATESITQEEQAVQELSQAEQAHGEAAVAANQQVQNSTEGAAEGYKEVAAAASEAAEAEKQLNNTAQAVLDKDYSTNGKKAAGERLRAAYENYQVTKSNLNIDENGLANGVILASSTEEYAAAGYELGQAWSEGLKQGIATSKLEKYVSSDWFPNDIDQIISHPKEFLSGQFDGFNTVSKDIKENEQVLRDYSELYKDVIAQIGDIPVPAEIQQDMEALAERQQMLRTYQDYAAYLEQEPGYESSQSWIDTQKTISDLAQSIDRWKQDLQETIDIFKGVGESGEQVFSTVAESANQSAEAEQKVGEAAESAATSVDKLTTSEEQISSTDTSSATNGIEKIGEQAQNSDQQVDELKEDLQELGKTPVETPTPTETPQETPSQPQQQENTGLKQTKQDIKDVVDGYNTLIKTHEEWVALNAIDPADWTDKDIEKLTELKVQRDAANVAISRATDLTSEEIAAQEKYNKKLSDYEKKQKLQTEYEQQRTSAIAERSQKQQEADDAAIESAMQALQASEDEIESNREAIRVSEEKAEAERQAAQAAQEAAEAEQAVLEAYKTLEKYEPQHQQNQAILESGRSLSSGQNNVEQRYAAAKQAIDAAKVSTEAITSAEEHYQKVVQDTTAIQAYQTLAKDIQKYTELTNKMSTGGNLTFNQQTQLQSLTNEMTRAWNVVKDYGEATGKVKIAQEAWNSKLAESKQATADFEASLGKSIGTFKSLAEAQERVNQAFDTGKGGQLKWSGEQQASGTAKWGSELQKVQYSIRQIEDGQYQVYEAIQSSQAATSTWGGLVEAVTKRFSSLVAYLGTFVSFYRIIGMAKSGISAVTEFNTQLTEMRKVSDYSTESLKRYQDQTFAVAKEVGSTAATIQASTADYLRLGKTLEESAELAKNTSILMSVSEFENVNEATEAMISMTQAFKEMNSMEIIDELNKIGEINAETYSNIGQYKMYCRSELYRSISYG